MSDEQRRELLESLGLGGFELGEAEGIDLNAPGAEQAMGLLPETWTLDRLRDVATVPAPAALLVSLGLQASIAVGAPGLVKFANAHPDEALTVRLAPGAKTSRVIRPGDDEGVAWVDARAGRGFVIETPRGRLLCVVEEGRIMLQEVITPATLDSLVEVAPPAAGWLTESEDPWLRGELAQRAEAGDSWSVGVAAGMHTRLTEPSALGDPREVIAALTRGEVNAALARPRQWVRSLSEDQVRTLERLALAEVDRLNALADSLLASDASSEGWAEDWRALCHGRDDVECVRVLLEESGRSGALAQHVGVLDEAGAALRGQAPAARPAADERSRRVWLADPDAWWGQPA